MPLALSQVSQTAGGNSQSLLSKRHLGSCQGTSPCTHAADVELEVADLAAFLRTVSKGDASRV
jgi:hypothetical protein